MSWQALDWCADLHHVKGPRRALLWAMANRHNWKTGLITMGLTSLANEAGLSRSAAHRHLKTLEYDGLIAALIPASGPRAAAYIIPALASHPDGTQPGDASVPPKRDAAENASVPFVTGSSDLVSHSGAPASHSGGTKPNNNQRATQIAAASSAPTGPAADAAGRRSAISNGVPPDAAKALAQFQADSKAKRITEQEAERQRHERLFGPSATEPGHGRDPPARMAL